MKKSAQCQVLLFYTFFVAHCSCIYGYAVKQPLVDTKYGQIRGTIMQSLHKRPFKAFRGIPYAQPPVGDLRFKEPQPLSSKWDFPLDATKDGPICIQKNYLFYAEPLVEGQEDCLYLNVYSPQLKSTRLLPVMVFIHWGAFTAGRGTSDYIGPEYFMDKNVILVTFNYRLGAFGFLTTNDDNAPGNYGMKDQVAALKWVQENIENFGGNKDNVTIFGQSAGGGSTHYHLLSPLSRGLFHKAISQSGSALALWAKPLNALQVNVTAAQAQFVGCETFLGQNDKLIDCLRKVPAEKLADTAGLFKLIGSDPLIVFTIVTEVKTDKNPFPFITKDPLEYIQNAEFHNVPWMVGTTKDEGILRVSSLVRQKQQLKQFNENFDILFPQMLYAAVSSLPADIPSLMKNITDFYLDGKNKIEEDDPKTIQGMIDIYTDRGFLYPTYQSVMLHSAKGHNNIFPYEFGYKGEYSYGDLFATTNDTVNFNWGVSHCDDLLYLFNSPGLFPKINGTMSRTMVKNMVALWTNFAKYGDPHAQKVIGIKWEPINVKSLEETKNENYRHLKISGDYKTALNYAIKHGIHKERLSFWTSQKVFENIEGLR